MTKGTASYYAVQTRLFSGSPTHLKFKNKKLQFFPFALYKCETWLLITMEEHELVVSENRVLIRISGLQIEDVTKLVEIA
jgi:hypothetical protein